MKPATTKQFRNAARLAISSLGGSVVESWTDAPGNNVFSQPRYVGFLVHGCRAEDAAIKTEQLLNAIGVTADARCNPLPVKPESGMYRRSNNYLRGTCVIG